MNRHMRLLAILLSFALVVAPVFSQFGGAMNAPSETLVLPAGEEIPNEELLEIEGAWFWFLIGCLIVGFTAGYFTYSDSGNLWLAVRNGVIAIVGGFVGATLMASPR
jgi:hypothetical protein